MLGGARLPTPLRVLGIEVWVDPGLIWALTTAQSNPVGVAAFALPVPADPTIVGGRLFAQFFWAGPTSPPPCPPLGVSASNALVITIQR